MLRIVAGYFGLITHLLLRQSKQSLGVHFIGFGIMRSKCNVALVGGGVKIGLYIIIEDFDVFCADFVVAQVVEHLNKGLVLLAIDGREFDVERLNFLKNLRVKKENAIVIAAQHLPFFLLYNGRELKEVANKQELNPAKRLVDPSNVAQRPVDGI